MFSTNPATCNGIIIYLNVNSIKQKHPHATIPGTHVGSFAESLFQFKVPLLREALGETSFLACPKRLPSVTSPL